MNSSIKMEEGFKKKIGKYFISFCQTQFYGKSLHGQMRAGYQESNNKVYIFRINPLPLTSSMQNFLTLQKNFSHLKQYSRNVYEDLHSSSFNYAVLEYFPKTFQSQIINFRKNPKYFDQMIQKFLKTYSFFFNMKVAHGNLISSNVGITFDSRVKLMDFQTIPQQANQQNFQKDFDNFKQFVSKVIQKDSNYPYRFSSFNSKQNCKWEHVFSSWHITSPLQPVYLSRKNFIQNIVTCLYKFEASLEQLYDNLQEGESQLYGMSQKISEQCSQIQPQSSSLILTERQKLNEIKLAIRLLQYNYLKQAKTEKKLLKQKQSIEQILQELQNYDIDYYNSVIIGAIQDFQFYGIDASRRLLLLSCLIPALNHEYIYYQIVQQFKDNQNLQRNLLLGDSLFSKYKQIIFDSLLKKSLQAGTI